MKLSVLANLYGSKTLDETLSILTGLGSMQLAFHQHLKKKLFEPHLRQHNHYCRQAPEFFC